MDAIFNVKLVGSSELGCKGWSDLIKISPPVKERCNFAVTQRTLESRRTRIGNMQEHKRSTTTATFI